MANFTNIPFLNPVKFYINKSTGAGIHLDDDFAVSQIKSFETKVCYRQKWQIGDVSKLQITSTIAPSAVVVYTADGIPTNTTFEWTLVATGGALIVNLYECTVNLNDVTPYRNYYLYFECNLLSYSAKFVSEPISVKPFHPNTLLFTYKNSYNFLGVYFSTGVDFSYRCEAGVMDYQPEMEGADYIDQVHDVSLLSATPYDTFKLYIGEAPGVPNYIVKTLNYIFACDSVYIRRDLTDPGLQFVKAAAEKWEATRVKGWPQFGWATTIQPAVNLDSLQYNDIGNPLAPGLVTAYDIDTNLFSTEPVEIVHITDITTI